MKNFKVKVTIERPGIFEHPAPDALRARAPDSGKDVRAVPASNQYVEVYQNELFGSFCGSAYTDAAGTLDRATFSGGDNYPNEIRLVVYGDSRWGFRVGHNSPYPWERLNSARPWQWSTPWIDAGRYTVDAHLLRLGADGSSWRFVDNDPATAADDVRANSFRAAAMFEILDLVYEELDISFLPSNWIVNDVIADVIGSPVPWTYWNTVHIRDDLPSGVVLQLVPHELGHVLYNLNHSGQLHYDIEDWMDYLHTHDRCSDFGPHFGHYEGFAGAFSNIFWRHHAQRLLKDDYSDPTSICDEQRGIAREGNVNAFYSYTFAGRPMSRPPESLRQWTIGRIGANDYAFPPTVELFGLVNRTLTEDLNEMWTESMNAMATSAPPGAETFCQSRRFRCLAMHELLLPLDEFPDEFKGVNCLPGTSEIDTWTVTSGSIEVDLTSADFVDRYEVVVDVDGTVTATDVDPDQFGQAILTQSVPVANCKIAKLRIRTHNDGGSTDGETVEVHTACEIEAPVITAVNCTYHAGHGPIQLPLEPDNEADGTEPSDNSLTELPATAAGFDCEVVFRKSPQADKHRYVHTRAGHGVESGCWTDDPDGNFRLWIEDWNIEHSVVVEARKFLKEKSSDPVKIVFPTVPMPVISMEMVARRHVIVSSSDETWRVHDRL